MNILIIIGVLLVCLLILVPLAERFSGNVDNQAVAKWSKWIFPLIALLMVLRLIDYYWF